MAKSAKMNIENFEDYISSVIYERGKASPATYRRVQNKI